MKKVYRSRKKEREFSLMPRQLLLVMKMMVIFLTVASLGVSARGFSQTITWSGRNVPLEKVFSAIEGQTDYVFFYNDADMLNTRPVTLSLKNVDLKNALNEILKNQMLTFSMEGKTIFIHVAPDKDFLQKNPVIPTQQLNPVHGTVIDVVTRHPLIGVTVQVKGTSIGTTTDQNGEFALSVPDNAVLMFSYVGYQQKEVAVNGRTEINVTMEASVSSLNQLVVVGYGTQKKVDLTGAVSVINSNDIKNIPVGGASYIMQGKAAGVAITEQTGAPGDAIAVRIRGVGTINNNDPLYIIDGVPTTNGINNISPDDIESINILKDAASAAIYGARASNGVVIITTKHGQAGKTRISFSDYTGVQARGHLIKMADTKQYVNAFNIAANADGRPSIPLGMLDTLPNVNWLKEILKPALISNIHLSISGGNEKTQYIVSGTYFKQDGLIKNSSYERFNILSGLTSNPSKWVTIGTNLNLAYSKTRQVGSSGDGYGAGNP
ncbi:MAG: SusC/RagA family TonB-linked outer membrane protein, partial [Chitinophagaceae bacterium]